MTLNNELKARFITSVSVSLIERCYQFVELDYKLLIGRVLKLIMICLGAAVGPSFAAPFISLQQFLFPMTGATQNFISGNQSPARNTTKERGCKTANFN